MAESLGFFDPQLRPEAWFDDDLIVGGWIDEEFILTDSSATIVGLAEEADSAFAVGRLKTKAIGLLTEVDEVLLATRRKTKLVGLLDETDSVFAVGRNKTRLVGLNQETDTALPLIVETIVVVGQAQETDSVFAVTRKKTKYVRGESDLLFFWRCGSDTLDGTHDFSAGDITASTVGAASYSASAARTGPFGILCAAAGSDARKQFNVTGLIDLSSGSAAISVQYKGTLPTGSSCFVFRDSTADNAIRINSLGGGDFELEIQSATVTQSISTSGAGFGQDEWIGIVIRWDQPNSKRCIEVYNGANTLVQKVESAAAFDAPVGPFTSASGFRMGIIDAITLTAWFDTPMVSGSYDEPLQNNFLKESYVQFEGQPEYEIDSAFSVGRAKVKIIGLNQEVDSVMTATRSKIYVAGLTQESDVPFAVGRLKTKIVGLALETDFCLGVTTTQVVPTRNKRFGFGFGFR